MTMKLTPAQLDRIRKFLPAHRAQALSVLVEPAQRLELASGLRALRDGISAYLPRYLVQVIQGNPVPGQVGCYFKTGTVMFADVSGFTAMSEKLSDLGKEGAEEMTGIVNAYFEAMLEISEALQGDLLKFGGDALMIFFGGDGSEPRALAASNAMQAAMGQFAQVQTSQGIFPLRMSIGMASGPIILLNLGSADEMYFTVMGRTLGRMAQMEERANAAQVVVDGQTAEACRELASFKKIAEGTFLLTATTGAGDPPALDWISAEDRARKSDQPDDLLGEITHLEALSPYIPDELLVRLVADPNHPVRRGSHRPVTNMFANFAGLDALVEDLGPGREREILAISDAYLAPMGQILNRYGGTISRLDNYSIGQRILALFGALQAHEDDPERAVRAGVEMNNAMGSVNRKIETILADAGEKGITGLALTQRIGINTGFVFAGSVGSTGRHEYTVMGAQVNLTARLMSIAREGDVLVGGSTARHVEGLFILEEKEAVKVKGISEAVKNFVVGGEITAQARMSRLAATPIQGREQELQLSRDIAHAVLTGQGRTLLISGESGIGKSRLIDEIVTEAIDNGMGVLDGACLSYGRTMTYHPWAEVLRRLFGFAHDQDPEQRIRVLTDQMGAIDQAIFTPLIGQVLGLPIDDNELTRDLDAKLRRQRVLDLVLQLLQSRADAQPLLVLIEDVHWADDASRDLIEYVGRNIGSSPILFLLSHRPDEDLPDWSAIPAAERLALGSLDAEACLAVARQILGDQPIAERLAQLILDKGGGNPLFLGEVIRNLMDAGSIATDADGLWDLPGGVEAVELPDTIHGMIISRMDRLEPADRRMLQVASVVGRSFSTPTLAGAYDFDFPQTEISQRIGELGAKGLVERMEDGEHFRFTHLTTQEVVYESLSYELRRDLHFRIGTHYEATHADSLNEWVDLLAYHFYEGHTWPKAATYNLQAGQRAQREYANEAAITALRKALEAAGKLGASGQPEETALPAHDALGEVYTLIGEYDHALTHLELAKDIIDTHEPGEAQTRNMADLLRKTADVYERQGEYEQAFQWLERALEDLEDLPVGLESARIYLMGAGIHHRQGKNDEAVAWCMRSTEAASSLEDRESIRIKGHAYYLQGAALNRQAKLGEALVACKESIRLYEQVDDLLGLARATNNLANVYSDLSNWKEASDAYNRSLEINQRIGNVQEQGFIYNNLGNLYMDRGDWREAAELLRESSAIWKKIGAPLPDAVTLSNLAQVLIYRNDRDEALAALRESEAIFQRLGSEDFLAELERRWAEYLLRNDRGEEALGRIEHSIELAGRHEARLDEGMSLRVLGEIQLALGRYDRAEEELNQSLQLLEELNAEYQAAKTKLALVRLERVMGKSDSRRLDEVIATFERLGAAADLEEAEALTSSQ